MQRVPAVVATTVVAAVLPVATRAQTVTGSVRIEGTGAAARGAWVALLDSLGEQRAAILTDTAGRYFLRAPATGRYHVRAQLIGHADALAGPLQLGPGQTVTQPLLLKERALPLAAINDATPGTFWMMMLGLPGICLGQNSATRRG